MTLLSKAFVTYGVKEPMQYFKEVVMGLRNYYKLLNIDLSLI